MIPNIGPTEIIIVLVIALIIFGPKRIPEAARSIGHGIRGFKESVSGEDEAPKIDKASAKETTADKSDEKPKVDS